MKITCSRSVDDIQPFKSLAVTLRTTRYNIQKFYVVLTSLLCFVWISGQTATLALHDINRLVLYNRCGSVYCAVPTESLHKTGTFRLSKVKGSLIA
jgi:hypothetical protein